MFHSFCYSRYRGVCCLESLRPTSLGESLDKVDGSDDDGDLDNVLVDIEQLLGTIMTRFMWKTCLTLLTIVGWTLTVVGLRETELTLVDDVVQQVDNEGRRVTDIVDFLSGG